MNKDINKTLMALVPILRMHGENVTNIEAVHDWYKAGDREYMKEVAEITYDNGTVRYADIGCDSNLTAIYDVIAVIQQITPRSKAIERIERGVYSLPSAQSEDDRLERCRFEYLNACKIVAHRTPDTRKKDINDAYAVVRALNPIFGEEGF